VSSSPHAVARPRRRPISALRDTLVSEAGGGLVLMASAALALVVANSALADTYFAALKDISARSRSCIG
jgi:NhaA family Na+:H+ antiporter